MKNLTQELLTENKYWNLWKPDFSEKRSLVWGGITKWDDIVNEVKLKTGWDEFSYERSINGFINKPIGADFIFD